MTSNISQRANSLITFIRATFKKEGFTKAVIGLSGGIDSATSCTLAVHALGVSSVYPILLPYGLRSVAATNDAKEVISWLKIPEKNVRVVDIAPMVDAAVTEIDPSMDDGRRGNVMARTRMVVLYDCMKHYPALVVGTENKTEHLLGYYTKFGDEASDIEPLRNLYKTQVYELARHLGVPEKFLTKAPTAGLWEGQTDEKEFGFTYKEVDKVLAFHFDEHISREGMKNRGFDKKLLDRVWYWMDKGEFKSRVPYLP